MSHALHQTASDKPDDVALVPFTEAHLPGALKLSQDLVWPFRYEDWAFALTVGQGFVLERGDEVVGTAILFPFGETGATAGMIIVSNAAQGRGYGSRLMNTLLEAAGSRTILLNATPEGRALYERRGFVPVDEIRQHQGRLPGRHDAPSEDLVRPMRAEDMDALVRLDEEATGFQRGPLLRRLAEVGEVFVLVRGGEPAGYAVSRLFGRGHVIGPVIAADVDDARLLTTAALSRLEGAFVRMDTSVKSGLAPWLAEIGLPQVSDALVMVRGELSPSGPARLFALSNQSIN